MEEIYIQDPKAGIVLRRLREDDMEMLREMLNDPRIEYSVIGWGLPVSKVQQFVWFHKKSVSHGSQMYFVVEEHGVTAGCIILGNIDWDNKTGELGIKILRKHQGGKLAINASRLMLTYCFDVLGMKCLYGSCLSLQLATQSLVNRLGFTVEGVQRSAVYKHGKRWDIVHFSVLKGELKGGEQNE